MHTDVNRWLAMLQCYTKIRQTRTRTHTEKLPWVSQTVVQNNVHQLISPCPQKPYMSRDMREMHFLFLPLPLLPPKSTSPSSWMPSLLTSPTLRAQLGHQYSTGLQLCCLSTRFTWHLPQGLYIQVNSILLKCFMDMFINDFYSLIYSLWVISLPGWAEKKPQQINLENWDQLKALNTPTKDKGSCSVPQTSMTILWEQLLLYFIQF